jgi:hypothetical protein
MIPEHLKLTVVIVGPMIAAIGTDVDAFIKAKEAACTPAALASNGGNPLPAKFDTGLCAARALKGLCVGLLAAIGYSAI